MPVCAQAGDDAGDAPLITSPSRGATYTMRLSKMTPIALRAGAAATEQTLFWFANDALIGKSRASEALGWLPARPGNYRLRAIDQHGRADVREVEVEFIP